MKNLIIDATREKILFSIISNSGSYTTTYPNSRENFDKFINLLMNFLKKNHIKIDHLDNLFINQGPGKFSSLRISIVIAKAIALINNVNLYGFTTNDLKKDENRYEIILEMHKKGLLIKDLINPIYSS